MNPQYESSFTRKIIMRLFSMLVLIYLRKKKNWKGGEIKKKKKQNRKKEDEAEKENIDRNRYLVVNIALRALTRNLNASRSLIKMSIR